MSKNMCASSKLLTLLLASIVMVLLLSTQANAGILRLLPTSTSTVRTTTTTTTTSSTSSTTLNGITTTMLENTEAAFLPKDIDEKLVTTTTVSSETVEGDAEEDKVTTENSNSIMALSRDKEATVKLAAKKNLNSNSNPDAEVLKIDAHKSDDAQLSKLLLSSVPKTSEKPRGELEENIEEPTETTVADDQIQTTTTIAAIETTTMEKNDDEQQQLNDDSHASSESESHETAAIAIETETQTGTEAVQEMQLNPHVDNVAHEVLEVEVEDVDEYLIVEDDESSDYEPHSETYVHSIQIVPSRLEAVLLENFVHDW